METRELNERVQYRSHPYPSGTPPINESTHLPDKDWICKSRDVLIFTHQLPIPDTHKIRTRKLAHFQYHFWTALDRTRRRNKPLDGTVHLWKYHDLQGMLTWWRMCLQVPVSTRIGESDDGLWKDVLMSSPWFDCPIFRDLLWEVEKDDNGQPKTKDNGEVVMKERDARSAVLEKEFFDRWWLTASKLPLRRFENGDAVLPITEKYYQAQYGAAGMQWSIPPSNLLK